MNLGSKLALFSFAVLFGLVYVAEIWAKDTSELTLKECISLAMKDNKDIIKAIRRVEETGGDRIIVRSRFLPHVSFLTLFDYSRKDPGRIEDDLHETSLVASQRFLEFGKDSPLDVNFREDRRVAIYGYESDVRRVLSEVRRSFFTVLLREEQIKIRQGLLEDFQKLWERTKKKEELRMADPLDILAAELDVLTEKDRINSLQRDQFRSKLKLLKLLGRPIGNIESQIRGELLDFQINEEEAVQIALKNSVPVALAKERRWEAKRVSREVAWEFMPDLTFQSGIEKDGKKVFFDLSNKGDTWSVDAQGKVAVKREDDSPSFVLKGNERDIFANLQLDIPIFEGLSRYGELKRQRERLRQAEAIFSNENEKVELATRSAYQSLLEVRTKRDIQERRAEIAKRRFEIFKRYKDEGKAKDDEVERFRLQFFQAQDRFFADQDRYINAREDLRLIMGLFE